MKNRLLKTNAILVLIATTFAFSIYLVAAAPADHVGVTVGEKYEFEKRYAGDVYDYTIEVISIDDPGNVGVANISVKITRSEKTYDSVIVIYEADNSDPGNEAEWIINKDASKTYRDGSITYDDNGVLLKANYNDETGRSVVITRKGTMGNLAFFMFDNFLTLVIIAVFIGVIIAVIIKIKKK